MRLVNPITQTVIACPIRNDGHAADGTPGDCMRAALATILGVDLHDVPHVVMFSQWWDEARRTVGRHMKGWDIGCWDEFSWPFYTSAGADANAYAPPFVIGAGPSPRGPFGHVVILDATTGEMVHDPHPSRAGILQVEAVYALCAPYEPAPARLLELCAGGAA
jgi:hypothetical protein